MKHEFRDLARLYLWWVVYVVIVALALAGIDQIR
jgi:hypothetical protein